MSISFAGKELGATFKEAVVVLEALQQAEFTDEDKQKIQDSMTKYIESKLWNIYPYDSERYFYKNPNSKPGDK